jgi:PKD repeat protein
MIPLTRARRLTAWLPAAFALLLSPAAVPAPALAEVLEPIDPYLAAPAANHLWQVPVVVISYLPTADGVRLNPAIAGSDETLASVRSRIAAMNVQAKFMLEEGSRFRGYANSAAPPSIGYKVVKIITVFEPMPVSSHQVPWNSGWYRPDYNAILNRWGVQDLVNNQGVKEFWIWGYHHAGVEPAESNMSSPVTGDVSNSERRNDDLPVLGSTYVVYNYNFTRSANEAVHNHGHQFEAALAHVNSQRDVPISGRDLFWKKFVGQDAAGKFVKGRCGWTHMPPNTIGHYDYTNTTPAPSDIQAWTPAGGPTTSVSANTWGNLPYVWPYNNPPAGKTEAHWYIYWMQNMPGKDNGIRHPQADTAQMGIATMTNWWLFTGYWDSLYWAGPGLVQHSQVVYAAGEGENPVNTPPAAALSASALAGVAPLTVSFDGSASSDADGTVVSWEWTFGDGTSDGGATASHTYDTPGTYPVELRVWDDRGATWREKTRVTVLPIAPPGEVLDNGSFETGLAPWEALDFIPAGLQLSIVPDAHTATAALRVSNRDGVPHEGVWQDVLDRVEAGGLYDAEAWIKLDADAKVQPALLYSSDADPGQAKLIPFGDWQDVQAGQWTSVRGTAAACWTGKLTSMRFLVLVWAPEAEDTTPDYTMDDVSLVHRGAAVQPAISITRLSDAAESGAQGRFMISRSFGTCGPLEIQYGVGGSASAGGDYQALPGTVTLPESSNWVTVPVVAIDDTAVEGDETVVVTLTASADYQVAPAASSATVALRDDDECEWWDAAWTRRRRLTLDEGRQGPALADVPVLVMLDESRIDYAVAQDGGQDLRFVAAGNPAVVLSHEIERWNENGRSFVWVKVPRLPGESVGAAVWLYYGNPAADDGQRPTGVWDAKHAGVYHFAGRGPARDSTAHRFHGETVGDVKTDVAGRIGRAFDFRGGRVRFDDHAARAPRGTGTFEMWLNRDFGAAAASDHDFGVSSIRANDDNRIALRWNDGERDRWQLRVTGNGRRSVAATGLQAVRRDRWAYVAGTWDASSRRARLYVDGRLRAESPAPFGPWTGKPERWELGRADGARFDGQIDEYRVSSVARSPEWIAVQHRSMTDRLISFGEDQAAGCGSPLSAGAR